MRLTAVRTSLIVLALPLGLLMLVAAAFIEAAAGVQRQAQAQNLSTVSVSCPSQVAAVGTDDAPGAVQCTFAVSPAPQGGLTVRYEVTGVGSRSLGYQQSVVIASASGTDRIYYLSEATEITVRIVTDSAYSVGSPSEATIAVGTSSAYSGAGLHVNEAEALDGYTLISSAFHNPFYLIDNQGRKAYSWDTTGRLGKLLDNGNLITGNTISSVNEISPDGTATYSYTTNDQHHDMMKLANGNFLFINSEYYTRAQSIAAGADPACLGSDGLEVDSIVEIKPTGSTGGQVVWKWNVWDHLIQDYDSTKDNYGVIKDHPELIDINYGICQIQDGSNGFLQNPHHLTHLNSIDYNASLDQILITSRHFSELWVIDHGTTTQQAATSVGGNSGMGGNLLYRFGNPRTHQSGSKSDQRLFFPHNAHWIPRGLQGAGNVLIYNNGHEHPGFLRNYASVDELALPATEYTYLRAGDGFMQPTLLWTHRLSEHTWIMANAQRLPNGNTLITEGNHARISEVTPEGDVVWHYISPLARGTEVLAQDGSPGNPSDIWVYRAYKYAADHPGIAALTLTPVADRIPLAAAAVVVQACTVTATADGLIERVRHYHDLNKSRSDYNQNWFRVLIAFGVETSDSLEPFTVAEAIEAEKIWDGWTPIRVELERREAQCPSSTSPAVSISAGSAVTEGSAASFTLTASPVPSAALQVNVNVTASGAYGVTTGSQTVTIPTSGTATFTVATTGDTVDETDGSVTVTLASGTGYSVDSSASSATVTVSDDDDPPPSVPEISISAGSGVIEGSAASFTLAASPVPSAALQVNVNVTASGAYGVTTGSQTVTIPTSGTATFTVATTGDSIDEADGSVTVALATGTGYSVDSSASSASVTIADDDTPQISISAGSSITEGGSASFTLTASPAPASALGVSVNVTASGAYGVTTGSRTVTIPTSGTATLTISTTSDSVDEPDGSVTVTLATGSGYDLDSSASAATVTVSDDDDPPPPPADAVMVSIGDMTITEGGGWGGWFNVMVTLNKKSDRSVTVEYRTEILGVGSGYASGGDDYGGIGGRLTFRAGVTERRIGIRIRDDWIKEPDETFQILLSDPSGAVIGDGQAIITIRDND